MEVRDLETNKWIDSSVFRREAINFQQNNTFCTAPDESPDWFEYWNEQLKRCKEGFSIVDGEGRIHKVTGNHYMYLNYSQLESELR